MDNPLWISSHIELSLLLCSNGKSISSWWIQIFHWSVCFSNFYYQTEPWIDSAGQPGGGVALHMQPWSRLETRGAKILIEISEACRRIITSAKIKGVFSSMTSVPSWLHVAHVEKYLSLTDSELKTKRKHWSSDITKACFPKRTNTKTVIFFAIVFGQTLSGHQVCSALPSLLQIYTILLITIWGDQNEFPAQWQPGRAESSLKPRHEWWFGLAFVWRVHARRCLTTSAGDLSPLSLLIFCPLKWKSVLRLSSPAGDWELVCTSQDPTALFLSVRWSRPAIYLQMENTILLTELASKAEGINSPDFLPSEQLQSKWNLDQAGTCQCR